MDKKFDAQASTTIHAAPDRVWKALTDPALIKQYFFGTDVVTDWKVGSPILYKGEWQGKTFEDKGKILKFEPNHLLQTTHWSPLSGVPDTPENYHTVSYELEPAGNDTKLTLRQDNNANEKEKADSEKNWRMMLDGLKKLLEA